MRKQFRAHGFTLLEIMLVVTAIAILAAIVIVAINPTKQLAQTKNAARRSDCGTIVNAIYQYAIDHSGAIPTSITTTAKEICQTGVATTTCTTGSLVDLTMVAGPGADTYIAAVPIDPTATTTNGAGYTVMKTAGGRITVASPLAELGVTISVTK